MFVLRGLTFLTLPLLLLAMVALAAERSDVAQAANPNEKPADGRTVEVAMTEFKFEPATVKAKPGEKLTIKVTNKGKAPHSIAVELPSGEVALKQPVKPGQSATLNLVAPQKPGKYTIYCPVGKHKDRGMVGELIVGEKE
jgi:plastocyanin